MNPETEQNIEELDITASSPVYVSGIPLYVLLPLCALGSTFVCLSGWRSGLRATLLGASLLLGLFLLKQHLPVDASWKKRTGYFALTGIASGLLAALIISVLEILIGSPVLNDNPYNQNTVSLFWMCPIYGLFMMGCFGVAFNLSILSRYFIVLAGTALANTFGLADMAANPDPMIYIFGILRDCVVYYIPCLGNCAWFVFLWNTCANGIFSSPVKKRKISTQFVIIFIGLVFGYFGFAIIGLIALNIKRERYVAQNKSTIFSEKLTGIIIVPARDDYYDCLNKAFYKIPGNINLNKDFCLSNKFLKAEDNRDNIVIAKLENGRVMKTISHPKNYGTVVVVNKTVYYMSDKKLFRLNPPDYDNPEVILDDFYNYHFCISPDEKFIVYYGGVHGALGSKVLCIMELKSQKILALRTSAYYMNRIFWVNDLAELK